VAKPKKEAPRPYREQPDGTVTPVEEKDIAAALEDGTLRYRAGERVPVISPSGKFGTVPAEELWEAGQRGYQVETPSGYKARQFGKQADVADHALAVGKEALGSASLGISDALGVALFGEEYAEQRRVEQQGLPTSTTFGMLGGFLFPGLGEAAAGVKGATWAQKGVRALGSAATISSTPLRATVKLGDAVGKGIAKRIAKPIPQRTSAFRNVLERGIEGTGRFATEGATIGAGHAVQHAALYDEELSVELLLSGAKDGAVLGALFGGPLAATGALVKSGGTVLKGLAGNKPMAEWLDEVSVGATFKQLGGDAAASNLKKVSKTHKGLMRKGKQIRDDMNSYVMADGNSNWQTSEQLLERVSTAAEEVGVRLGAMRQEVAKVPIPPRRVNRFLKELSDSDVELRKFGLPQNIDKAAEVQQTFLWLQPIERPKLPNGKLKPVTVGEMNEFHKKLKDIVYPKATTPGTPPPTTNAVEPLRVLERELSDVIDDVAERALTRRSPAQAGQYREMKRFAESFIKARQLGEGASVHALGAPFFSVGERMAHIVGASLAWTGGAAVVPPLAGAMVAQRLIRTRGAGAAAGIAESLANFARSNAKKARGAEKAIRDGVKKGAVKVDDAKPDPLSNKFAKQSEEVVASVEVPEAVARMRARQTAPLQALSPDAAPLALTRLSMGDEVLAQELPVAAPRYGRTDLGDGIPDAEKEQWLRLRAAVRDAPAAFAKFKKGELSIQEMHAIKKARPRLYEAFRSTALAELVTMYTRKEVPDYDTRVRLSDLLGIPLDATQTSMYLLAMQTLHQGAANKEAEQAAEARKAQQTPKIQAGRREPDFSERARTRENAITR
jgi:hypothetical protein